MKTISYSNFSFFILLLMSCGAVVPSGLGVQGSGNVIEKVITVEPFTGIKNKTTLNVNLKVDSKSSVKLFTDDNIMELFKFNVSRGILTISHINKPFSNSGDSRVDIRMPEITSLAVSGTGDYSGLAYLSDTKISCSGTGDMDIKGRADGHMNISISGTGNINLKEVEIASASVDISGTGDAYLNVTDKLDVNLSGTGDYTQKEIAVASASVSISGVGDAFLNVSDRLEVKLSGAGDLEYIGTPEISKKISGIGDLVNRN